MKDETNNRYGKLVVLEMAEKAGAGKCIKWLCQCDCGERKIVSGAYLRKGTTRSCGCMLRESNTVIKPTHGMSRSSTYGTYRSMHKRCYNPKASGYSNYGGRGIKVCELWHTFENFLADMGVKPEGTSLDRIDTNRDYEPSNCRWATTKVQGNNRRTNREITANGKTMNIAQWAEELGVSPTSIGKRLRKGMSEDETINKPFRKY